jgi:hypothetical protein
MADKRQIFYIYDTINGDETPNHREHRSLIANMAKRSRYFIANTAKIDRPWLIQDQREIGYRFVEGIASGTVLIGEPPETDVFREHFDWTDAVIHVPFHTREITKILADLDSQPDRLEEIRTNNVVHSLLRHDWVHRWRTILDTVGLEPTPGTRTREKRLEELAEMAKKTHDSPASRDTRPKLGQMQKTQPWD